jgi:hypothetical protein
MSFSYTRILMAASVAAVLFAGRPATALVLTGNTADEERNEQVGSAGFAGATFRAGSSGSFGGGRNGIFMFDLTPFINSGDPLASADLQLTLSTVTGTPAFNVDLYGVGFAASATDDPAESDYYEGAYNGDTTNTTNLLAIQDDFLAASPTPAAGSVHATNPSGDSQLLAFLNSRPAGANFAFFRISPDVNTNSTTVGFNFHSADATNDAFRPKLALNEQVPEPGALAGGLACAAAAMLRRRRSRA